MKFVSCKKQITGNRYVLIPLASIVRVENEDDRNVPSVFVDNEGNLYTAATLDGMKNPKLTHCVLTY